MIVLMTRSRLTIGLRMSHPGKFLIYAICSTESKKARWGEPLYSVPLQNKHTRVGKGHPVITCFKKAAAESCVLLGKIAAYNSLEKSSIATNR